MSGDCRKPLSIHNEPNFRMSTFFSSIFCDCIIRLRVASTCMNYSLPIFALFCLVLLYPALRRLYLDVVALSSAPAHIGRLSRPRYVVTATSLFRVSLEPSSTFFKRGSPLTSLSNAEAEDILQCSDTSTIRLFRRFPIILNSSLFHRIHGTHNHSPIDDFSGNGVKGSTAVDKDSDLYSPLSIPEWITRAA